MTLDELKAEAEKHGHALIPKDQIECVSFACSMPNDFGERQKDNRRSKAMVSVLKDMLKNREIRVESSDELEVYRIIVIKPEWDKK